MKNHFLKIAQSVFFGFITNATFQPLTKFILLPSMHIYKLSNNRAICHYGSYNNPLFYGSSFNNQDKKKAAKKVRQAIREAKEIADLNNSFRTNKDDKQLPTAEPVETLGILPIVKKDKLRRLSTRSKYKIRDKITAMFNCSSSRNFTFVTLSFIAKTDDKTAQKTLNKFLTSARKKFGNFLYIWVAERQENKNIHFHLITNKRFPIVHFNALWVLQQYNSDIVHSSYSYNQIITAIADGTLNKKLNPMDIKQIKTIDGLSNYLTTYVSKNNDLFKCAVWHCSRTVSKLFTSQLVDDEIFEEMKTEKNTYVDKKTGQYFEPKIFVSEHAVIVNILNRNLANNRLKQMNMVNRWIIEGLTIKDVPMINYMDSANWTNFKTGELTAITQQMRMIPKAKLAWILSDPKLKRYAN